MVQAVTTYKTSDGKVFDNEVAANGHETSLKESAKIEGYIAAAGLQKAQAGLMRKHIGGYLAFVAALADVVEEDQPQG